MNIMLRIFWLRSFRLFRSRFPLASSRKPQRSTTTPKARCHPSTRCIGAFLYFRQSWLLMGLFFTLQLDAEIYQWVDENGVKHYSNMPPADAGMLK